MRIRTVRLSPADDRPQPMEVDNYNDGEWVTWAFLGEPDQLYVTLSQTPPGEPDPPEGFHNVACKYEAPRWVEHLASRPDLPAAYAELVQGLLNGQAQWADISPDDVNRVQESGTVYAYAWGRPFGREWLRASGSFIRLPAARTDPAVFIYPDGSVFFETTPVFFDDLPVVFAPA